MSEHQKIAKLAISLMDLTSLNDTDNSDAILALCKQARTPYGDVAAICVYSSFIEQVSLYLKNTPVHLATVVNFPCGNNDLKTVLLEVEQALNLGAQEIDLVLPYQKLMAGDSDFALSMVKQCKSLCQDKLLKVIIESGELKTPSLIQKASEICIEGGADFIKTSTGKVAVNATLTATKTILSAIKSSDRKVGMKVSGGVKTIEDVTAYIEQAQSIMGENWVSPRYFRFGASSLLNHLLAIVDGHSSEASTPDDY